MMVAPGRSAQPLASIGRRPSWNHAMSGTADGLASQAIFVGSLGAGLSIDWAAAAAGFGAGAGCGGGGDGSSTRGGTHTAGSARAGITSGRAAAGWELKSEVTHYWATMAPQPTTTAAPAKRRQRLPRCRPRVMRAGALGSKATGQAPTVRPANTKKSPAQAP